MLNSLIPYVNATPDEPIVYAFTPGSDGNTIVMHIRHFADMPSEHVKQIEATGRTFAHDLAKSIALSIVLGYNLDNGKDGKSELNAGFEWEVENDESYNCFDRYDGSLYFRNMGSGKHIRN